MDGSRVRPRHLEWPSLLLWPPACIYGAFVLLSIPGGKPIAARTAIVCGLVLSVFAIAASIRRLLAYGYWWQDDDGLRRGRIATLYLPWSDVESYVVGMPPRLPLLLRVLRQVPTESVQRQMESIDGHRRAAIVLRLRGKRLLPIGLTTASMVGGAAFRAAMIERLAGKEQPMGSYSDAEKIALARVAYTRVIAIE